MEDKEHDEHVRDESNFRRNLHAHDCKKEELSANCHGTIVTFTNGMLRMIDNDEDSMSKGTIEEEVKNISDDFIQAINDNEVIAATHASVKNENITGA